MRLEPASRAKTPSNKANHGIGMCVKALAVQRAHGRRRAMPGCSVAGRFVKNAAGVFFAKSFTRQTLRENISARS